jgi:lysozyme family protein
MSFVAVILRTLGLDAGEPAPPVAPAAVAETASTASDALDAALAFTLPHEGGFVDDPDDPGGRTNLGIAERSNPEAWADDVVTPEEAREVYRAKYWKVIEGDRLPRRTALATFDFAVHSGPGTATRAVQRAVGSAVDGDMGPATIAAVERAAPDDRADAELALRVIKARAKHLATWMQAQPVRVKYAGGFLARLIDLTATAFRS